MHVSKMEMPKVAVAENDCFPLENKGNCDEIASDRESSVESFHTNKSELSIPTESELIDIDEIELSDEESWLYKSPKKQIAKDKELSTYNWLQKEVEYVDDLELLVAKKAFVNKLDELKVYNTDLDSSLKKIKVVEAKALKQNCDTIVKPVIPTKETQELLVEKPSPVCTNSNADNGDLEHSTKKFSVPSEKESMEDIIDVHEKARLQEESLRQSTLKFLSQIERRPIEKGYLSPIENIQGLKLTKPVSVEALHLYSGKQSPSSILNTLSPSTVRRQSPFSSTLSLNHDHVSYRGSLPNINNGYNSLRQKKPKRIIDQKILCPLPIHPSKPKNLPQEMLSEPYSSKNSPTYDSRESRTLPSSYRMNRNSSATRRGYSPISSPRRESTPLLSPQSSNSFSTNSNRRESAPSNGHKFMSPAGSPTQYRRSSGLSPMSAKPTRAMSVSSFDRRSSINSDHTAAHSPTRRLPLSTMLNQSPRCGRRASSPLNGEGRVLKMPSKIPSPANRSAIPVPSQYISKPDVSDDSWSQDFF